CKRAQCSAVDVSAFARSDPHVATATISSRRFDGDVGNGATPEPRAGNGPNVVCAGHGKTVWDGLMPSDVQVPSFHLGGPGWAAGQSVHQTSTLTWLAGDGPRVLTFTTVTVSPTTWIASGAACQSGGSGGFAGFGSGTGCQSSDTGM